MKYLKYAFLLGAGVLTALPAWAQPRHPGRHYDPKAVVTVQGQVEKVETFSQPGRRGGMETAGREKQLVYLKTAQGTMTVHLGPVKFLEQQQFAPKVGETMSVTGAKTTTGRGDVIVAAQVQAGGQTLTLRDAQGTPVWRSQGRKPGPKILDPKAPPPSQ